MDPHSAKKVLLVGLTDIVSSMKDKLIFRELNFEEATTSEEALEKARVTKFHRIVLNVNVPSMDGIEAARRLREENSCVKIILVSGLDRWSDCIEALEIGIEDIIMKPIGTREFLRLLGVYTGL